MPTTKTQVKIDDGGPMFPVHPRFTEIRELNERDAEFMCGCYLRQYAAIELSVPNSGIDWLDEMIVESNKYRYAGLAMQALCGQDRDGLTSIKDAAKEKGVADSAFIAGMSFELADSMISVSNSTQSE